ncbi:holo-ACP synthase [Rahnella bruchi]|uniref:holo-ACP synthase n=1 Tax=Rahnella bruchi TaxID=1510573 RepID=UPI000EA103FC|nr:holo-ACP synthase [Rahnella bruchi]
MVIGTDVVEIDRIRQAINWGEMRFLSRVYTENELKKIHFEEINYERAAGFWAAKESVVKAIGTGFRNGITFQDIEIDHDEYGCPFLTLKGKLKQIFSDKQLTNISVSISHCRTYALAVTILS